MIKVGVTGSNGFIGWHLCRTLELDNIKFELVEFKRDWFNEKFNLDLFISKCDIIVHLAGLNRHSEEIFIYNTNINSKVIGPKARHPLSFKYWYDVQLSRAAKKFKADVIVSLDGFCSLTSSIPQILAVHDLAYLHYPDFIPWYHLWFYKLYQKLKKPQNLIL